MNLTKLTFFDLHVIIYEASSVYEATKILGQSCHHVTKTKFGLTPTELRNINPFEAEKLLGELYRQPIKSNPHFKEDLLTLLPESMDQYKLGAKTGREAAQQRNSPSKNILKHPQDYLNGYEDGYTSALLDSAQNSFDKGKKLGILAARFGKKNLNELRIFANRNEKNENNSLFQDPNFLAGFDKALIEEYSVSEKSAEEVISTSSPKSVNHNTETHLSNTAIGQNDSAPTITNFNPSYAPPLKTTVQISDLPPVQPDFTPLSQTSLSSAFYNYCKEYNFAMSLPREQETERPLVLSLPTYCANSVGPYPVTISSTACYSIDKQVPLATSSLKLHANYKLMPNHASQPEASKIAVETRYQFFSKSTLSSPPLPRSSLDHSGISEQRRTKKIKTTP